MAKVYRKIDEFSVGTPSTRDTWTNPECQPFSLVSHVSHVDVAPSIVADGIKAGLVYDDSSLNSQRILVSWVSPKTWPAYRYGNAAFHFDWLPFWQNYRLYYVETVQYSVPAYRILVTKQAHSSLLPYDPRSHLGPYWYNDVTDTHYHNGRDCCVEFMVEDDIPISTPANFSVVSHHDEFCSVHRFSPRSCRTLRMGEYEAEGVILALLAATGHANLTDVRSKMDSVVFGGCCSSLEAIVRSPKAAFSGAVKATDSQAALLVEVIFSRMRRKNLDKGQESLISLFASRADWIQACRNTVANSFGMKPNEVW